MPTPPPDRFLGQNPPSNAQNVPSHGMHAGDVLGFSGRCWLGVLVNLATWGRPLIDISHVAIVAPLHSDDPDRLVLWESRHDSPAPCLFAGEPVEGMQAHEIEATIEAYRGRVYRYPIARSVTRHSAAKLAAYLRAFARRRIPYDYLGAVRARGACCGWVRRLILRSPESLAALYCSELVPAALRSIGEFRTRNASAWSPNRLCRALVRRGCHGPRIRQK